MISFSPIASSTKSMALVFTFCCFAFSAMREFKCPLFYKSLFWQQILLIFSSAFSASSMAGMWHVFSAAVNATCIFFCPCRNLLPIFTQMMLCMFASTEHAKIIWRIIKRVMIFMMHMLIFMQSPVKNFLHNMAMFANPYIVNFNKPIIHTISVVLQTSCPLRLPFMMRLFLVAPGKVFCMFSLPCCQAVFRKTCISFESFPLKKLFDGALAPTSAHALFNWLKLHYRNPFITSVFFNNNMPAEWRMQHAIYFA